MLREYERCSSVVTLLIGDESLDKIDRCAGTLLLKRKQLLVLHFFAGFQTESLRLRRILMYLYTS